MKAAATSETATMVVEQAVFLSRSSPSFLFVRFKKNRWAAFCCY